MPNRLLREGILDSDPVNLLSWPEEVFYRRLMSAVDDFGRFDARTAVLKSRLYPLKSDSVRETDIARWIAACVTAGLISLYSTDGRPYLLFKKFKQHVRAENSKFPPPPPDSDAVHGQCKGTAPAPHVRSESDAESKTNAETETGRVRAWFEKFFEEYPKEKDPDDAWAAFRELNPGDDLYQRIVAAMRAMAKSEEWLKEHGRYIPTAAKWLREKGWKRVRTEAVKAAKPPPSRLVVEAGLKNGTKWPPEILALYPDLAAKYPQGGP